MRFLHSSAKLQVARFERAKTTVVVVRKRVQILLRLLADLFGLAVLAYKPRLATAAENLVLRRQLALFKERGIKPRHIDAATRISLAGLSLLCNWRTCLTLVRPETVLRWHRAGWRLFWGKGASRPPATPLELRQLIRRMANENPTWPGTHRQRASA